MIIQIALLVIGITGLVKKRIKVSSKKELAGGAVTSLSIFYIIMAAIPFVIQTQTYGLDLIGIILVVTVLFMIFAKKKPVSE